MTIDIYEINYISGEYIIDIDSKYDYNINNNE